ncbi:hypothetical protein HOY80DRAFT_1141142 [Tuber brumale]|nr:hypothetical protein HOY80DRAFT_1141142 [Tuber brumale]
MMISHMFASTLANNGTTPTTNQPEAAETKSTKTKTTETTSDGSTTKARAPHQPETVLTLLPKDLTTLDKKVDDGFRRQDNWTKFILGTVISTIVVKFAYTDNELEKKIQGNVHELEKKIEGNVHELENRMQGNIKEAVSSSESRILLELTRMEMRLTRPEPQGEGGG